MAKKQDDENVIKDVFPYYVRDFIDELQGVIFHGKDSNEEEWEQFLSIRKKESVALAMAIYYICKHCNIYHRKELMKVLDISKNKKKIVTNMTDMILFLRVDNGKISDQERNRWVKRWREFSKVVDRSSGLHVADFIGCAIGLARNDGFLIDYCGASIKKRYKNNMEEFETIIGELEAVTFYMKLTTSKNRVMGKVSKLFE